MRAQRNAPGAQAGSARRRELLAIAERQFATRGFAQTTIRDIADEAGILSGSLYHHFPSKEAMLGEALQEFLEGLLARSIRIVEQGDRPREVLDQLIRESFATINAAPDAVALYQNEKTFVAETPGFEFVAKLSRDIEKLWLGVIKSGRAAGEFRTDLDVNLTYRFIRDTVWSTVGWYRLGGRFSHHTVAEQYLSLLHGGMLKA